VLTDTGSTTGQSITPICDVSIEEFNFIDMHEQSDYSGPMVAYFSGKIKAELSCDGVAGTVQLHSDETNNYVGSTTIEVD